MVFITAGMGGGTGTGASPVIAEVAQELGILTVAVVTKPFSFEGGKRMRNAELGLNQLKNRVHSLIVILNDKLEEELGEDATMRECFEKADEVLFNACAGIAELIQKVGQINLDFEDVRTVMGTRGTAMMGSGEAEGPDRAVTAASMVNITAQEGIRMSEVRSAMETIKNYADSDALIVFGTVYDDSMGDKVRVTVIATGLDQNGTDDSIVKTSFVNGKPAPLRILCRMICSATSTHLPNLRFTLLPLRVQLLLLLSRRRIALQHRPTQQLPPLRLQSLKSRLKKLRRKSILSELIHRSLRKRLSRLLLRRLNQKNFSPKPSIRSTRLSVARSQRLMPAVSKARKTTRFSATSTPATTSVLPATCSQP